MAVGEEGKKDVEASGEEGQQGAVGHGKEARGSSSGHCENLTGRQPDLPQTSLSMPLFLGSHLFLNADLSDGEIRMIDWRHGHCDHSGGRESQKR
jgi:hypothetical protein